MAERWKNWSGSLRSSPEKMVLPESEEELAALVKTAAGEKKGIRAVGAGHSSSPLVATGDYLVSLKHFTGMENPLPGQMKATVLGGTTVHHAGKALKESGLAMHNTGDVDVQVLAGAIGTGTHGTGKKLQNLSSMLIGGRMVTGTGEIVDFSEKDTDLLRALRISLGTCGIFTRLDLKLLPLYELKRTEWCAHLDDCMANLEKLTAENRNFDFYWYPRSDMVKMRLMNEPGQGMEKIGFGKQVYENQGFGNEILPRTRHLKFDEMEYALPAEVGPDCFQEIRSLVKKRFRKHVAWRILYRTVRADNALLSPAYGRDTVTISLHQNAGLPFWEYFKAVEPIFRNYNGRPHWGKKHTLHANELRPLYPEWGRFLEYRNRLDPHGTFLSPYMKHLLLENP